MANTKRGPGRPPGSKNKNTNKSKSNAKPNNNKRTSVEKSVQQIQSQDEVKATVKDDIISFVLIALGIFLIVALQTHAAGVAGEAISKFLKGCFGFVAFFLPYYFIVYGVLLFLKKTIHTSLKSIIYLVVIYLMIDLINAGRFMGPISDGADFEGISIAYSDGITLDGGGVFGMAVGSLITKWIGISGLYILSFLVIFIFLLLLVNTPISRFFENIKVNRRRKQLEKAELAKAKAEAKAQEEAEAAAEIRQQSRPRREPLRAPEPTPLAKPMTRGQRKIMNYVAEEEPAQTPPAPKPMNNADARAAQLDSSDFIETPSNENYVFPPIDLLQRARTNVSGETPQSLQQKAMRLEDTLRSFNIDATVTNVTQGPTVTRYEVHPNSGVKVRGIKNLADDIALNMEAKSIRIEAPIPGKPAVGIEIENEKISMVTVREIIASDAFKSAESKLTFVVGKDIAGKAIVADLKAMPHLLIAGSTGSGKSVCINSIITSILYKARPDEVKMVLIDPKVVELSNYNGIPHLLIPVVTDPSKAAAALNWAVAEMDERYRKFAEHEVRDLTGYNKYIEKQNQKALKAAGRNKNTGKGDENSGAVSLEPKMPQVVIIIDELADLMMVAPSQVEESICRLAQKARAAGMHLIVATQRPSVDVITGLIKANIPSRIAFAVSSQVDSRTILDMGGAEKLVGKGDMLFNPLGTGKPTRVQGSFISDSEVHNVIEFVKTQGKADEEAANDVLDRIKSANTPDAEKGNKSEFEDELLPEAIELVVDTGQASVSMLQRRFRIGYNRAARIIDMMEERQIVGPQDGSRPRQVLISEEDLKVMQESTGDMTKE
ncbi:MAG: DNA translocase FtsK 4TM domain-containing protein [Bacillota bacterium]|nr:DNA translocase FtsK 4TM domain-containing protein [Bacillota bacterium]